MKSDRREGQMARKRGKSGRNNGWRGKDKRQGRNGLCDREQKRK